MQFPTLCPALLIQLRYGLWLVVRMLQCPELIIKIFCIAICFGRRDLTLKQELNERGCRTSWRRRRTLTRRVRVRGAELSSLQ